MEHLMSAAPDLWEVFDPDRRVLCARYGDGRVRIHGSRFTVERYPSGRWRFNFTLPDVPPGRVAMP